MLEGDNCYGKKIEQKKRDQESLGERGRYIFL